MSDQLSELNQELEERKELVLRAGPGDPSALVVADMVTETQQWVAYAYQKAQEGDIDQVGTALATVHEYLNQIASQSEMAGRVIAGLHELVDSVADRADKAEKKAEEMEGRMEEVRADAYDAGQQTAFEVIDEDEIHDDIEETFHESVEEIVQVLVEAGYDDKARELEQAAGARRDAMNASDNMYFAYRELYWKILQQRRAAEESDEEDDDVESEDDLYS